MQEVKYSRHTGICPKTGDCKTIGVEFFEIQSRGSLSPSYKRKSMNCDESESCPLYDARSGCPLYREAESP